MKKLIYIILVITIFFFTVFSKPPQYYQKLRSNYLKHAKKVYFAIVWPFETRKDFFKKGILLAQKEINNNGGILNKKLYFDFYSYKKTENGVKIIREIVKNPKYSVVLGFYHSALTSIASVICNVYRLIIFSCGSIESKITEHKFPFTFRNMANNKVISQAVLKYMQNKGYKRIAIIHTGKNVNRDITRYMLEYSEDNGIKIISNYFLQPSMKDYRFYIQTIKALNPDVLFFTTSRPEAEKFIIQMNEMNFKKPIVATDIVDDQNFIKNLGKLSNGIVTYSMFNPAASYVQTQVFIKKFQNEYNKMPDAWAAAGYDAVKLIAATMKTVKSIDVLPVASMLHFMKWDGALGNYKFNLYGDILNKRIFFKKIKDGKFVYLEDSYVIH